MGAGASHTDKGECYFADELTDGGETVGETTFDPAVTKKIFALAATGGQPQTRFALDDPQISPLFGDFKVCGKYDLLCHFLSLMKHDESFLKTGSGQMQEN
jgi:hypothetical protein